MLGQSASRECPEAQLGFAQHQIHTALKAILQRPLQAGPQARVLLQEAANHMRSRVGMPSRPRPSLRVPAVRRQRARRELRAGSSALSTGTWS